MKKFNLLLTTALFAALSPLHAEVKPNPLFSDGAASQASPQFQPPRVREPGIPNRSVTISDFGAVPDGRTLNTVAIAKAIDTLAAKGGGHVVFPPGYWLTGPIALKSNIDLHLEEGALVQFTTDFSQYPDLILEIKGVPETVATSQIHGEHQENISITGRGVFDGGGSAWRQMRHPKTIESQWKKIILSGVLEEGGEIWWPSAEARKALRPKLVKLFDCRKVLLEGVTFQNSPSWNLNPEHCQDLTIRNVSVHTPGNAQNGDGVDLECCRNAIVRGSTFDVGDDAICIKSGRDKVGRLIGVPTENVLIEDCIVYHGHGGFVIGSEMSGGARNICVNNCLFMGTDIGLRFKSTRGRGGVVEKIFIKNIRMIDIPTDAIGFDMFYHVPPLGTAAENTIPAVDEGTPIFRDIYIEDVICRGAHQALALQGLPEMPIRGIHLRNVSISAENGIVCTNAQNLSFDQINIQNTLGPVVILSNSRNLQFAGLRYAAGAEAVFKAQGTGNGQITIKNTDLKPAKEDLTLTDGATRDVFNVQ